MLIALLALAMLVNLVLSGVQRDQIQPNTFATASARASAPKPVAFAATATEDVDAVAAPDTDTSGEAVVAQRGATRAPRPTRTQRPRRPTATPEARAQFDDLIVRDQRIYALDGSLAYEGDVDLAPTLARIEAGRRDKHPNDGGVFGNREGLLPRKPRGHYLEWVVRTPGLREVGPQRVITGKDGEVYYTPDHYESFIRIR